MYINFRTTKSNAARGWEGIVNTKTGEIIARSSSKYSAPHEKRLNIKYKVNQFPCTDEDLIVLAARKALKEVNQ